MVHAALLLLMLEAVTTDLVFTISLKRSTQNLQLSTSWPADYPIYVPDSDINPMSNTSRIKTLVWPGHRTARAHGGQHQHRARQQRLSGRRGARRALLRLAHRPARPQDAVLHHADGLSHRHRGHR